MNTTIKIFKNDNGRTYTVIAELEFNAIDKEYYKNSWQQKRAMLLEDDHEYVVAQYVGENSWGYGYYADSLEDATKKFNEIVAEYMNK